MTTRLASLYLYKKATNLEYLINRLTLIKSISYAFQLPISQLDEARISEHCKGEKDGGYRAPASGIDSTQFRCATQGRQWLFRLVRFFITVFHPTILNTWNLAPRSYIKLPYGKVETGNVASVTDFVQS